MIKAVLFDFDGTLINTNELIFESYRVAFKKALDKDISVDDILELYGRPLKASLMKYGDAGESLYNIYREYNDVNHDIMAKGFEGASEGVKMLRNLGYKIGIVTSKRLHMVKRGLKIMDLDGYFDVIVTPDDTEKYKPDPEPILLGCEKLGVLPSEAVYVGDSIFDMQSAKAAGAQLCTVRYTLTPHEKFLSFDLDYFVDSIVELANLLKR